MLIDKPGKTLYIDIADLSHKWVCPVCGRRLRANGTGPTNKPLLTKALQLLPSEKYIGGFAPKMHDVAYTICPAGWALNVEYLGKSYTAIDKFSADIMYRDLMHAQVNRLAPRYLQPIMHINADRNYQCVIIGGHSSYAHKHR